MFKRGRYVSVRSLAATEADQATQKTKREERERFSVAAIAFCLDYDKKFQRHFLHAIARRSPEDIGKITLEPDDWGDLVLEGKRHVLVVEFKLGALLQGHQSPHERDFWKSGYGAKIRKRFDESGSEISYIVVGKEFEPCMREGLSCSAVPWRELRVCDRDESDLERDLFDCLGHLGAPAFLNRHMKNTKLTGDAFQAIRVYGTLLQVLAMEGIKAGRSDCNAEALGVEISKAGASTGSAHAKLVDLVKPPGRIVGWIGYECLEDGKRPYLSVWFYCTSKTVSKVRTRLEAVQKLGKVTTDGPSLAVHLPGDESTNDVEWFQNVLRIVAGIKTG